MADGKARRVLDAHERRVRSRGQFDQLWEEVTELLAPRFSGFTSTRVPGDKRTTKQYDTSPANAARELGTAVGSLLMPKDGDWFELEPDFDETGVVAVSAEGDIVDDPDVKMWLHHAEQVLAKALYNPRARWQKATGEANQWLAVIGNGFTFATESADRRNLLFRTTHMANTYFEENADGWIDNVALVERLPVRVAAGRWGEDNLGDKAKEALRQDRPETEYTYIQVIEPRMDRDPRREDNRHMPYAQFVVERESEHLVRESGFPEFPGAAPRWDTTAGETYARGPGTAALPDAQTANQIKKTLLKAGHRAVDPPWAAVHGAVIGALQNRPGGTTFFDPVAAQKFGRDPVFQLDSRSNIPFGLDLLEAERRQIDQIFYRDILNLPVKANMTAEEVIERRQQFVRNIGGVFDGLEGDYVAPLIERAFGILMRRSAANGWRGPLYQPPELLFDSGIRFKFSSPITQARKQIQNLQTQEWVARVIGLSQVNPDTLDLIDFDAAARLDAETNDIPPSLIRSKNDVAQKRQERQQLQTQQQGLAAVQQMTDVGKSGAEALNSLGTEGAAAGLGALTGALGGAIGGSNGSASQAADPMADLAALAGTLGGGASGGPAAG